MFFKQAFALFLVAIVSSTSSGLALPFNGTNLESDLSSRTGLFRFERYIIFNNQELSFFDAVHACESMGFQLATINSAADDAELKLALRRVDGSQHGLWWIAGTDLIKQGQFMWISTHVPVGYPSGYTNWAEGEPNNAGGNEHCIEVGHPSGTLWNDCPCEMNRRFICENI